MLLIPTYVAPSATHGVGLFCAEAIPAGRLIWTFTEGVDLRISRDEMKSLVPSLRDRMQRYCYREDEDTYVLCTDNAKFMNHSFSPNCDDSGPEGTVALRDIEAGEELTCDYRVFDLDSKRDGLAEWWAGDGRPETPAEAGVSGTDLASREG